MENDFIRGRVKWARMRDQIGIKQKQKKTPFRKPPIVIVEQMSQWIRIDCRHDIRYN